MVFEKGHVVPNEWRLAVSESRKGKVTWMKGKHHTLESKLKNSIKHLGKHHSPNTEFKKGRKNSIEQRELSKKIMIEKNPFKGKKHNQETLKIISKKSKLMWKNPEVRAKLSKTWFTSERMNEKRKKQVIPVKDTSIEIKIQNYLKQLGITFFTHQYIKEIEHGYQCDILIPSMNLIIECDGNYWHYYPTGKDIDHIRTKELLDKGFKVLRLWECDINKMSIEEFKNKINL